MSFSDQSATQGASAAACLAQWGALVCSCCGEEQPVEVKLTAAKVLVNSTGNVLTSPRLPLGESQCVETPLIQEEHYCQKKVNLLCVFFLCLSGLSTTLSLWKSLFTLLQDEDQEVRGSASDFLSVPAPLVSAGTSAAWRDNPQVCDIT